MPEPAFLPYGRHWIDEDDIAAVAQVLRGDWLTQGPKVAEFEEAVAQSCGAKFAVACNSGTSALHLALLAAGVGPHAGGSAADESICPAITFLASSNCALYAGARPRFTDIDFPTMNMTAAGLEPLLNSNTRAVLPVHFAGLAAPMAEIAPLVRSKAPRAVVIEDACHAPGSIHPAGAPVGSLTYADMVMFSFHPVKHAAAGEAGVILTDRADLNHRLRLFRSHGMTKDPAVLSKPEEGPWYYEMIDLGYNFRLPDMNCALGLSQWKKLPGFVARRRAIAARYHDAFAGLEAKGILQRPFTGADAGLEADAAAHRNGWHIYILRVDWARLGTTRKQLVAELQKHRIGTQVHYFPVPHQPYYREHFGYAPGDFPQAEKHYEQALTIPLYPAMTDADVGRVIVAIHEVLGA
jgi:UDP-4-amino-4,6-dideoxy-N-acetyl-beta-L-altrosamine transaminase